MRTLVASAVLVLLAGCNSPTQPATTSPAPQMAQAPDVLVLASPGEPSGVITGLVGPCAAIPPPGGPPYYPAIVTLRRGTAVWQPIANGWTLVLPNNIVASTTVNARQPYRMIVSPGQYVLTSSYLPSGVSASDNLTVDAGETLIANLNPICK